MINTKLPATKIAHWPNQDVACCDYHADKLNSVAAAIGFSVSFSPAPEGTECINCHREFVEAKAKQPERKQES